MDMQWFMERDAFAKMLGIRLVEVAPGYAKTAMDLTDDLKNGAGIAHGGALAREILDAGAPGVHFYTFNKAQPALDLLNELPELTPTN